MSNNDHLARAIAQPLAALAAAQEYAMSLSADIIVPAPRVPDCPDCGGSAAHAAWVSFTERCASRIHQRTA